MLACFLHACSFSKKVINNEKIDGVTTALAMDIYLPAMEAIDFYERKSARTFDE